MAEITREVSHKKAQRTLETVLYLSSRPPEKLPPQEFITLTRDYWTIEAGLHQRLDVSAREDHSRVRNRNSILALGMVRRSVMGFYYHWRRKQKRARHSTLADFHDSMRNHNRTKAWRLFHCQPP